MALLDRMKTELPEVWSKAQVVGTWIWLDFDIPPVPEVRAKLKELGFHWNGKRKCWQHPCGAVHRESSLNPSRTLKNTQFFTPPFNCGFKFQILT